SARVEVDAREAKDAAPDDHFAAGPHCRMLVSGIGRVGGGGGCPTVGAGIISPAGVQIAADTSSAPDDHFAAGPDCRVTVSGSGRVGKAGGCPCVVGAQTCGSPVIRLTRYCREVVVCAHC